MNCSLKSPNLAIYLLRKMIQYYKSVSGSLERSLNLNVKSESSVTSKQIKASCGFTKGTLSNNGVWQGCEWELCLSEKDIACF